MERATTHEPLDKDSFAPRRDHEIRHCTSAARGQPQAMNMAMNEHGLRSCLKRLLRSQRWTGLDVDVDSAEPRSDMTWTLAMEDGADRT
jgi:hypothetical protein